MKKIQDNAALFFILCASILTLISVLGVWEVFGTDVITKSYESIGLLAFASVIVIFASHFIDIRNGSAEALTVDASGNAVPAGHVINPIFVTIRHMTIAILIASIGLLALLGIMSIWDVLSGSVMSKALTSIGVIAFDSFIIVMTCLQREQNKMLKTNGASVGVVVVLFGMAFLWFIAHMV